MTNEFTIDKTEYVQPTKCLQTRKKKILSFNHTYQKKKKKNPLSRSLASSVADPQSPFSNGKRY